MSNFSLKDWLEDQERSFLVTALIGAKDCKAQAARMLGIKRTNLVMKMQKYGLMKRGQDGVINNDRGLAPVRVPGGVCDSRTDVSNPEILLVD